ncbi:MAG: tRNA(Ile)(2)-agmatinylcytidine synthase [Candidatus Hadarchaeales archaeon]
MMELHVGIDDTDSKRGMCTTYVGAVAVHSLREEGVEVKGFPKLIRLNPMWPYKTRGNCAVSFTVEVPSSRVQAVKERVLQTVSSLAEMEVETTNPGVVFYASEKIPEELKAYAKRVVQEVVELEEAEALARKLGAEVHKFKLGRGIIGALAAIGHTLEKDRTYELIAYRSREYWGKPRRIDPASVLLMDRLTYPHTFDNLDHGTGEIRITPHTPCPVLYGIRGESPEAVLRAHELVKAMEPLELVMIYQTNQGTDEHLRESRVSEVRPYTSVILEGRVVSTPRTIPGGHVVFTLDDGTGAIDCAAYEPTRGFREVVRGLREGDRVRVFGGVREEPGIPRTINLEKLSILELAPLFRKRNPRCPKCGKSLKSEGRNKGYSCKKCGLRFPKAKPELVREKRKVERGSFEVPPRCRRHLAKPLVREIHREY